MELEYSKTEPAQEKVQVAVFGGGPAGVCAAIAAARCGAKTLLVEQYGACGGMATQGLVGPFMTCYDRSGQHMVIHGLFEEIVDRMVEKGGAIHPSQVRSGTAFTSWITAGHDHCTPFEPEVLKRVLDEMLLEADVKILYHTAFLEPCIAEGKITGARVYSKSGIEKIEADVCIDCTGDGDVARGCGAAYEDGNEALGIRQPATMFFRVGGVDAQKVEDDIQAHIGDFYRKDGVNYRSMYWHVAKARAEGDWTMDRVSIGLYRSVKPDEWAINTSRVMGVNAIDNRSLTAGEIEGRRQVEEIFHCLKKYVPGFENARLLCSGATLGIRESCHIHGRYELQTDDLLHAKVPADSVFVASNSVDVHGRFGPKSNEYMTIQDGEYYGVPYRSLLPEGVGGLLIAGRCLSASSEAAGAVRVMPPVMAMGQAAGTAAALAVRTGCEPAQVDIGELQRQLRADGVYLPQ